MVKRLEWGIEALTLALFLAMTFITLPRLKTPAGEALDLREWGYAPDAARAYLAALGAEGRAYYLNVQHTLDLLFPALLAASFCFGFVKVVKGWRRHLGMAMALGGALADYAENATMKAILRAGPEASDALLRHGSHLTIAKSLLSYGALVLLVGYIVETVLKLRRAAR